MRNGLTNLVPIERQRVFSRDYLLRLGVVSVVLANVLVTVAGILLIPTYVYLVATTDAKAVRLAEIDTTLTSGDEKQLFDRLVVLASDADILITLQTLPSASTIVRALFDISRPGITLTGINYSPAPLETRSLTGSAENTNETKKGVLAITGTAVTRDALRNYQLALASVSFSRGADLPVSAYAKDSNIPFTITVTLAP